MADAVFRSSSRPRRDRPAPNGHRPGTRPARPARRAADPPDPRTRPRRPDGAVRRDDRQRRHAHTRRALRRPLHTVEWAATGYLLACAVSGPAALWAVDRFGGRRVWLLGLVVFTTTSVLAALSWSVGALIVFRILQGLGGGMLEPVMLTLVARAAGPARAGRAMAAISLPITLGPALGPILGAVILDALPWQWMFLVNLPLGIVATVLALRFVPADGDRFADGGRARFDARGLALLAPGFGLLLFGLSHAAGGGGFGSSPVIVGTGRRRVPGRAATSSHALREGDGAIIDVRLFASRGYAASVVVMSTVGAMIFPLLYLVPLYYQQARGESVLERGPAPRAARARR
ncbi:MFS transporter [Yinghuangia aomiensis]